MDIRQLSQLQTSKGQQISDAKKSPKTFEDIKNAFLSEYEEHSDSIPQEDGTVIIDYQTGNQLGLCISNWDWEADRINYYQRLAKKAGLKTTYNGSDDLVILSEETGVWMTKFNEKLEKISSDLEDGKKPKTKVSKEDFEQFKRWSTLTGYLQYHDYDYSDIASYLGGVNDSTTYQVKFPYVVSSYGNKVIIVKANSISDAFEKAKAQAIKDDSFCCHLGYSRRLKFVTGFIKKVSDASYYIGSEDDKSSRRFQDLKEKFGDDPKHYISQLARCKGAKQKKRVAVFYQSAISQDLLNVASAIKEAYPEDYDPMEVERNKKIKEEEEAKAAAEARRKKKEEAKAEVEKASKDAIEGGKSYCSFDYNPDSYMASPDKLFVSLIKKHPTGMSIIRTDGNTSVGASYEHRNGRIWTIAHKYTVSTKNGVLSFDIASLTNEGWDPNEKSGYSTKTGKKVFVGRSYGWFLDGVKRTFSDIRSIVQSKVESLFKVTDSADIVDLRSLANSVWDDSNRNEMLSSKFDNISKGKNLGTGDTVFAVIEGPDPDDFLDADSFVEAYVSYKNKKQEDYDNEMKRFNESLSKWSLAEEEKKPLEDQLNECFSRISELQNELMNLDSSLEDIQIEMEDLGDESKAGYYGSIMNDIKAKQDSLNNELHEVEVKRDSISEEISKIDEKHGI